MHAPYQHVHNHTYGDDRKDVLPFDLLLFRLLPVCLHVLLFYCSTVVYVSSPTTYQAPTPLFTRKLLHRVQKQCSKGPPITKVLSSIS